MDNARSKKLRSSRKQEKRKGKRKENDVDEGMGSDSDSTMASSIMSDEISDDIDSQEMEEIGNNLEMSLIDNIEGATAKSAKERQHSMKEITKGLSKKYLPDFIDGQPADKALAASISSLLCIQLGPDASLNVYKALKPILITAINDTACPIPTRACCASALGMVCFIGSEELQEVLDCMAALRGVFSKNLKDAAGNSALYCSAVSSWGLLMTVASEHVQQEAIERNLENLCELLESGDLALRIATGEVIALIYELGRDIDENFDFYVDGLYDLLKELATDSSKYRAKREKKQQRSIFRDILKTVESGIVPTEIIKFGTEQVDLGSWTKIRQYNALKDCLASGTTAHLQIVDMLLVLARVRTRRESSECTDVIVIKIGESIGSDMFELGPALIKTEMKPVKEGRWEKSSLQNAAANKERTRVRSKGRENKRAAHGL
eukprot:gene18414-20268_t